MIMQAAQNTYTMVVIHMLQAQAVSRFTSSSRSRSSSSSSSSSKRYLAKSSSLRSSLGTLPRRSLACTRSANPAAAAIDSAAAQNVTVSTAQDETSAMRPAVIAAALAVTDAVKAAGAAALAAAAAINSSAITHAASVIVGVQQAATLLVLQGHPAVTGMLHAVAFAACIALVIAWPSSGAFRRALHKDALDAAGF
jgi:hypothetical protein